MTITVIPVSNKHENAEAHRTSTFFNKRQHAFVSMHACNGPHFECSCTHLRLQFVNCEYTFCVCFVMCSVL